MIMPDQTSARIDAVRAVGIPVSDQDRAVQFYGQTLGFEKVMDAPIDDFGGRWIEMLPPESAVTVALTPANEQVPAGVDTGIRFTTRDAAALHRRLTADGVGVDELLEWEGVPPMFDFRDPDGNVLYVSEATP